MVSENYITIPQLAKLLHISRIAVYKKVKAGLIPAKKIGKTYIIADRDVQNILHRQLTGKSKKELDKAIDKVLREYSEVLKLLGNE